MYIYLYRALLCTELTGNNSLSEEYYSMQVENIVSNFIKTDIGSVIITDEQKNVIYSEGNTTLPDNVMKRFISRIPPAGADQKKKTWELTDSADGHYYRIVTSTIEEDGKLLQCHCLTDVTDFVSLSKDISTTTEISRWCSSS